jgi:hypothetical protein
VEAGRTRHRRVTTAVPLAAVTIRGAGQRRPATATKVTAVLTEALPAQRAHQALTRIRWLMFYARYAALVTPHLYQPQQLFRIAMCVR